MAKRKKNSITKYQTHSWIPRSWIKNELCWRTRRTKLKRQEQERARHSHTRRISATETLTLFLHHLLRDLLLSLLLPDVCVCGVKLVMNTSTFFLRDSEMGMKPCSSSASSCSACRISFAFDTSFDCATLISNDADAAALCCASYACCAERIAFRPSLFFTRFVPRSERYFPPEVWPKRDDSDDGMDRCAGACCCCCWCCCEGAGEIGAP